VSRVFTIAAKRSDVAHQISRMEVTLPRARVSHHHHPATLDGFYSVVVSAGKYSPPGPRLSARLPPSRLFS